MIIRTETYIQFLLGKGFAHIDGEPFSFERTFANGDISIIVDDEYSFVDLTFEIEGIKAQGQEELAQELEAFAKTLLAQEAKN